MARQPLKHARQGKRKSKLKTRRKPGVYANPTKIVVNDPSTLHTNRSFIYLHGYMHAYTYVRDSYYMCAYTYVRDSYYMYMVDSFIRN